MAVATMWDQLWRPVDDSDERVRRGSARLARRRRQELSGGVRHVGWKVGWNDLEARQVIGVRSGVVGFLTSGTVSSEPTVSLAGTNWAGAEVELALRVRADVSGAPVRVAAIAPAVEVVNVSDFDVEAAVAANVWHHAAVVGPEQAFEPGLLDRVAITVRHGRDELLHLAPPAATLGPLDALLAFVDSGARLLDGRLADGDIVLSGNLAPRPQRVAPGDVTFVDYGRLGSLTVRFVGDTDMAAEPSPCAH
jgi:2-keto-4-pentenoate hydratase